MSFGIYCRYNYIKVQDETPLFEQQRLGRLAHGTSVKKKLKTYKHRNIVYNSSQHCAIHALKSIAHMIKQKEYGKSFAQKCA